jgi:hypothetical protein
MQYLVTGGALEAMLVPAVPLSTQSALGILTQIAAALDCAHALGVVHRDIKPANILVASDGTVKLTDFGIARITSQTVTQTGVTMGTPAYMAPEQIMASRVDGRADQFSLAVVAYQMLSGKRPFEAPTDQALMFNIVSGEPRPLHEVNALLPRAVAEVIGQGLSKDPKRRYRSCSEFVAELRTALTPLEASTAAAGPPQSSPAPVSLPVIARRPANLKGRIIRLQYSIVAATLISLLAVWYFRESPGVDLHEMRVEIDTPATKDPESFALSPDGRLLAYVATADGQSRLWVRQLASTRAQPLAIMEGGAAYPFWSPDSRWIGFFSGGKLKKIPAAGGLPWTLAEAISGRGASWSAEGLILFAPTTLGPLFRTSSMGGTPVAFTKTDFSSSHRFPQFLADGRHFLYYAEPSPEKPGLSGSIYLGAVGAGDYKPLTAADTAGLYMPPNWLLWVRGGVLVARHLNVAKGELSGDAITVAEPVFFDTSHAPPFSVSATGLVTYRNGSVKDGAATAITLVQNWRPK